MVMLTAWINDEIDGSRVGVNCGDEEIPSLMTGERVRLVPRGDRSGVMSGTDG